MKILAISATAAAAMALSASPAFAKAHAQPADAADFAQGDNRDFPNSVCDGGVTDDARGFCDAKGVDGQEIAMRAKSKPHPDTSSPNRQGPK